MDVRDQLQRLIKLPQTPTRIVSLVPSQTELLVDLGLRESLVGITKFCVHPEDLRKNATVVGGTKSIHLEKIKALKPDLVICNKEENTEEIVQSLSEFVPVWVSDIYTIKDAILMIKELGALLKVDERAKELCDRIFLEQEEFVGYMKRKATKKVAYLIWKKPYMAAGKQTFIHSLLQLNKYSNIFEKYSGRYPAIRLEDLNEADLILVSSEPYPFKETDVLELKNALQKEVRLVDGEYFSWYGSRLVNAFAYFRTLHD